MKSLLSVILISVAIALSSCSGNAALKKDAKNIAAAMCRNIENISKLKAANPGDFAKINELQAKMKQTEVEMSVLYSNFKAKYKDKMNDEKFNKEFAKELRKAMLDCSYLSKEDRANFEKEIQN